MSFFSEKSSPFADVGRLRLTRRKTIAARSESNGTPTPIPTPSPIFAELLIPDSAVDVEEAVAEVRVVEVAISEPETLATDATDDTEAVETARPE